MIVGFLAFPVPISEMATATNSRANLGAWGEIDTDLPTTLSSCDTHKPRRQRLWFYLYKVAPE
jgi:hypothetical protein